MSNFKKNLDKTEKIFYNVWSSYPVGNTGQNSTLIYKKYNSQNLE